MVAVLHHSTNRVLLLMFLQERQEGTTPVTLADRCASMLNNKVSSDEHITVRAANHVLDHQASSQHDLLRMGRHCHISQSAKLNRSGV